MALSQDIKMQFAKTVVPKRLSQETTVEGTFKTINGKEYVQLDGSDILTPVKSTVSAETGDRVKVLIKEHEATVNGNITSPSARSKDLDNIKDEVDEYGNTIKQLDTNIQQQETSIIQMQTNINQHEVTINQHETTIQQQGDNIVSINNDLLLKGNEISAINTDLALQGSKIESMDDTIKSHGNSITEFNNTIVEINNKVESYDNQIEQMGNKIIEFNSTITTMNSTISQVNTKVSEHDTSITTMNSDIVVLNSGFKIEDGELTGLSDIIVDNLKTTTLNTEYATIDFSNIKYAAVEKLFTDSGIINNLVVDDQHITGELVGVTIKGDLIEGNTIKADKLVVLGDDGLYYKLNTEGAILEEDQDLTNSLNGRVIVAKSITASKIAVDDLVAFGATIGDFNISENSLFSGVKGNVDATNPGIYLGSDGQMNVGDGDHMIKFFKDGDQWKLNICADELRFGTDKMSVEMKMNSMITTMKTTGGSNLLRNSVGFSGTDFWHVSGTVKSDQNSNISLSGSQFEIKSGSKIWQEFSAEIGNKYNIACKIKHAVAGTADNVSIKILGNNEDINVYTSTDALSDWLLVTLKDPFTAMSNLLTIEISCGGASDTLYITDLIISNGETEIWSPYFDEVYGVSHQLDPEGLRFSNSATHNSSKYNSDSVSYYHDSTTPVSMFSKDLTLTDNVKIIKSQLIGRLKTVVLDNNNIIEYIES